MRTFGVIKVLLLLGTEWAILNNISDNIVATVLTMGIVICAILAEPTMLVLDKAVNVNKLDAGTSNRLGRIKENLSMVVKQKYNFNLSRVRLYVMKNEDILESKTYGIFSIGLSKALLQLDDVTLQAILSNELAHILRLDVLVNRIIKLNFIASLLLMMSSSFLAVSLLWIGFVVMCLFRKFSIWNLMIINFLTRFVKGFFKLLEELVMTVYGCLMEGINHRNVYQADKFVCELGFGRQLTYYLERFADLEGSSSLFGGHSIRMLPPACKRIERIQTEEGRRLKTV